MGRTVNRIPKKVDSSEPKHYYGHMGINEETQTKITVVVNKSTQAALIKLVERRKRNGYKSSVSRFVNELIVSHLEYEDMFRGENGQ